MADLKHAIYTGRVWNSNHNIFPRWYNETIKWLERKKYDKTGHSTVLTTNCYFARGKKRKTPHRGRAKTEAIESIGFHFIPPNTIQHRVFFIGYFQNRTEHEKRFFSDRTMNVEKITDSPF